MTTAVVVMTTIVVYERLRAVVTVWAIIPPLLRKRIYIAYTGGTIGMLHGRNGYYPAPGYLQKQMRAMPELRHASMPSYTIHDYKPLLDSSNMTTREWVKLAGDIAAHYDAN